MSGVYLDQRAAIAGDALAALYETAIEFFRHVQEEYAVRKGLYETFENAYMFQSMNMIMAPHYDELVFQEPAVKAIIEGFERAIAENSKALYILHDGEAEPRKAGSWERFLAYEALRFFVEYVPDEDRNGAARDCFNRAEAILARVTVNPPRGKHDPRLTGGRDFLVVDLLCRLEGCGLPVTSMKGPSLARAMSKAWGSISENQVAKIWRDASPLLRPDRKRRIRRCAKCGEPAGEGARLVGDGGDRDLLCHACQRTQN